MQTPQQKRQLRRVACGAAEVSIYPRVISEDSTFLESSLDDDYTSISCRTRWFGTFKLDTVHRLNSCTKNSKTEPLYLSEKVGRQSSESNPRHKCHSSIGLKDTKFSLPLNRSGATFPENPLSDWLYMKHLKIAFAETIESKGNSSGRGSGNRMTTSDVVSTIASTSKKTEPGMCLSCRIIA